LQGWVSVRRKHQRLPAQWRSNSLHSSEFPQPTNLIAVLHDKPQLPPKHAAILTAAASWLALRLLLLLLLLWVAGGC
jgi:hypothetical protein